MVSQSDEGTANAGQLDYWNSGPGQKWIAFEDGLDATFQAVSDRLFERAQPANGERVLDIGCGTGATTMALASLVGKNGHVIGIDISEQLLTRAEERKSKSQTEQAHYQLADAQTYGFEPGGFDLMTSRFGVMFFDNPVAAFSNLASALREGGRISFVSWAPMAGNPWFEVPRDAAIARMGKPSPASPRAPGPLAFADRDYVLEILHDAGFSKYVGEVETVNMHYPGAIEDVAYLASNIGPAVRIVREFGGDAKDLAEIGRETMRGFEQYVVEDGVRIPAILNFFDAVKA
jgi:SAM-dependent methyltransferase